MSPPKRVLLARIGRAHGIRGEVHVETYTADPAAIADYGPLQDAEGRRTFEIANLRVGPKGVVARIAGVGDRTAAEALRGIELFVDRSRLPEPEAGEYYHTDLEGLSAVDRDGKPVGTVVGIANYGAGDLVEIRRPGARETELVPFTDAFVPEVDLAARRMVVVLDEDAAEPDDEGEPGRQ